MEKGTEELPLEILLLGPPGAGKSTVAVEILYKWGKLPPWMTEMPLRQLEQRNLTHNQLLALLPRPQGRSQVRHYVTPKYLLAIANVPRFQFLPNRSKGTCVLLLISAVRGDFEASWGLLRQQVSFACRLHVRQVVVCVNQLDAVDPPYSRQRYDSIVGGIWSHLSKMGKNPNRVAFLPISASSGSNMHSGSPGIPWYQGWKIREEAEGTARGTTLWQLLDALSLSYNLESYYTEGAWSAQEERTLLSAWKAMARPASSGLTCPHTLFVALLRAGFWRSPEQCRSRANALLNGYITARLQGRLRSTSAFHDELQVILAYEASQCLLQLGRKTPRRLRRLAGISRTSASPGKEGPELTTAGPSGHPEPPEAGRALGTEEGPGGVHAEGPQSSSEGSGDLPTLSKCLSLPKGQWDQDPDGLLTGLEIKSCERIARPAEPGGQEGAWVASGQCLVHRMAHFALKQKPPTRPEVPEPLLAPPPTRPEVLKPLLAPPPTVPKVPEPLLAPPPTRPKVPEPLLAPPLPPRLEATCPPPPGTSVSYQLLLPPISLLPSQWSPLSPGLALPGSALVSPQFPPPPLCLAPGSGSADALLWQYQQAHVYVPPDPVGHWPSTFSALGVPWSQALLGERVTLAPPGLPAAAAPAPLHRLEAPALSPQVPPWEPQEPCDPPLAAAGPEAPPAETSASPSQPTVPPPGSGLGLSAAALLSSLARLDLGEDGQEAGPPRTPRRSLSWPLGADSGASPPTQLQSLLGSSSCLPPASWVQLGADDDASPRRPPSAPPCTLPPPSPLAGGSSSHFLNCLLGLGVFCWWSLLTAGQL